MTIKRHQTAIRRNALSRPARLLLGSGLIERGDTFFDYGCGRGEDVTLMQERGFEASGWDPYYNQDASKQKANFVAMTYVINVIEDPEERADSLLDAWSYAERVFLVSAQVTLAQTGKYQIPYADGILTGSGTFQKYYTQQELKTFIEETLETDAFPIGLGVFCVFRHDSDAAEFEATRFHRRIIAKPARITLDDLENPEETLEPLLDFYRSRGRFPRTNERDTFKETFKKVGGPTRAERFVTTILGDEAESIAMAREEDLLLFLALSHFQGRKLKFSNLSKPMQGDIKTFCGSLKKATETAKFLLYGLGEEGTLPNACRTAEFGKLLPDALYVHTDYIDRLPFMLRLYEGVASRYMGRVDGATLVKFHLKIPRLTYLFYPDFETDAHPALEKAIRVSLADLEIELLDFSARSNPPILHKKELFVTEEHPTYEKFAALSRAETAARLYTQPHKIGTRDGWQAVLDAHGVRIEDHEAVLLDK